MYFSVWGLKDPQVPLPLFQLPLGHPWQSLELQGTSGLGGK